MTIKDLFSLSDIYLSNRGLKNNRGFLAGAELEIEAVRDFHGGWMEDNGITPETDGSLRNGGREFLLPPSSRTESVELFQGVHSKIDLGANPFSYRTSIHVHVNCMYSTPSQVKALLYLYAIFEPLAFSFVGEERKNNIHCTPLWATHMPNLYRLGVDHLAEKWHKYTAFNILPLRELGTVEFRHLYGTDDAAVYQEWLLFISRLWQAAHDIGEFDVKNLTDLSFLKGLQNQLMTSAFLTQCKEPPQYILEDNLLDVKLSFIG